MLRVQGSHNLQTSFALWFFQFFLSWWSCRVGFAVLKLMQWLLPLSGSCSCCRWEKRGWWDSRSFSSAVLAHSLCHWGFLWPVWHSCFCRATGDEAAGQHCSCSRLGLGGLSQHLPASLAEGAWEGSLPPAWDAGTCALAVFHPVPLSRSWCFHQRFLSPHWSLQCLDVLSYIFFMAFHLQGRAMPCSFWPTCALDI